MKTMIVFATVLLSITAQAKTYKCMGLAEQDLVTVELNSSEPKTIGTFNGARVNLSEMHGLVSLTLKKDNVIFSVAGKSGLISFHQFDGTTASSVDCIEAQP